MADVDAAEELQSYFIGFDDILQQLNSCTDTGNQSVILEIVWS